MSIESVQVAVRVRPFNQREKDRNEFVAKFKAGSLQPIE